MECIKTIFFIFLLQRYGVELDLKKEILRTFGVGLSGQFQKHFSVLLVIPVVKGDFKSIVYQI